MHGPARLTAWASSLKDVFEVDGYIRERLRGNDSVHVRFSGVIVLLGREPIDVDCLLADIDNPVFWDAGFFVHSEFVARIIIQRGIGDFDDQVNVLGCWMSVLDVRFVQSEVRLGFIEVLDANGLIDRDSVAFFARVDEGVVQFVYDCPMFFAYWSHANNLAIEQFHSFGWGKDSRFSELIILGDREFSQFGLAYGDHKLKRPRNLQQTSRSCAKTIEILNQIVAAGVIEGYAIAGAVAAIFYTEPTTVDHP